MSGKAAPAAELAPLKEASGRGKSSRKMIIISAAALVLILAAAAGLWRAGLLPGTAGTASAKAQASSAPVYVEMPEVVANLNGDTHRQVFIKVTPRIQIARAEDKPLVLAAMPRLQDMFQTYLREMRPEELKGSAGTYRLREALIARANIAAAPAHIVDVLFTDLLIQ